MNDADTYGLYDVTASVKAGMDATPFSSLVRLKLIYYLLQSEYRLGGCKLPLHTLLHKGAMKAFFPLHDKKVAGDLLNRALQFTSVPGSFPVDEIRQYFGEKFALFFE